MSPRDHVYLQILKFGLVALRNASFRGDVDYWKVESEHLHNIPSLIGESNESRHDYYFSKERTMYLSRVKRDDPEINFAVQRYEELWPELEALKNKAEQVGADQPASHSESKAKGNDKPQPASEGHSR